MIKEKHYVIGDIHGEYDMLIALVEKLPQNARLIFVGDLINRGSQSREVVEFVRNNAFAVVRGNHEEYLLKYGKLFLKNVESKRGYSAIWPYRNISSSLRSYGVLHKKSLRVIYNKEGIMQLKNDMAWMAKLPLCFEMGYIKGYSLPVVITHGSIDKYWLFKDSDPDYFAFHALNNRYDPSSTAPIFNIYGHRPRNEVYFGSNFVSLDTGCGRGENRKLSAYCIETKEVFDVHKWELEYEQIAS